MAKREIIKTENVLVRIMELEKGASTDWHFHSEVLDFFVCLKGAIQVETKGPDMVIPLQPGQQTEVTPMKLHRVTNIFADKAEYLLVQGIGSYDFLLELVSPEHEKMIRES
jgi:quercetin dioxygenase-like cupin family protein